MTRIGAPHGFWQYAAIGGAHCCQPPSGYSLMMCSNFAMVTHMTHLAVRRHGGPLPSVLESPVNRPFLGAIGGLGGGNDGKTAGGSRKPESHMFAPRLP
jgi:hypothetical protein